MRKLFVKYHTGYCGMDSYELVEVSDDDSDEDIAEMLYVQAVQHAESYGIEFCTNGEECEDSECEYEHEGSSNIEASWELYDPKKHDCYLN